MFLFKVEMDLIKFIFLGILKDNDNIRVGAEDGLWREETFAGFEYVVSYKVGG